MKLEDLMEGLTNEELDQVIIKAKRKKQDNMNNIISPDLIAIQNAILKYMRDCKEYRINPTITINAYENGTFNHVIASARVINDTIEIVVL